MDKYKLLELKTGIEEKVVLHRLWQLMGAFPNIKSDLDYKYEKNREHAYIVDYCFSVPDQSFSCHVTRKGVLWWHAGRKDCPYYLNITIGGN